MERMLLTEARKMREKMVNQFFHTLVFTDCFNNYIVVFEFFYICFNIFNWLHRCSSIKPYSCETESLSNVRYHGRMSRSILDDLETMDDLKYKEYYYSIVCIL